MQLFTLHLLQICYKCIPQRSHVTLTLTLHLPLLWRSILFSNYAFIVYFLTCTFTIMIICRHYVFMYYDVMYGTSMPVRCDASSHHRRGLSSIRHTAVGSMPAPLITACIQTGDLVRMSASLSSVVCYDCDWLLKPVYFLSCSHWLLLNLSITHYVN